MSKDSKTLTNAIASMYAKLAQAAIERSISNAKAGCFNNADEGAQWAEKWLRKSNAASINYTVR